MVKLLVAPMNLTMKRRAAKASQQPISGHPRRPPLSWWRMPASVHSCGERNGWDSGRNSCVLSRTPGCWWVDHSLHFLYKTTYFHEPGREVAPQDMLNSWQNQSTSRKNASETMSPETWGTPPKLPKCLEMLFGEIFEVVKQKGCLSHWLTTYLTLLAVSVRGVSNYLCMYIDGCVSLYV